jgi:hypothetical protein
MEPAGQAVSSHIPTAVARVRAQARLCGICGAQIGTGVGFLLVLSVSPANSHSTDCSTLTMIYRPGWYNRPVVAVERSGLSLTSLQEIQNYRNQPEGPVPCSYEPHVVSILRQMNLVQTPHV